MQTQKLDVSRTNPVQALATVTPEHRRVWVAAAGVVGFALLTAISARIAIPIPGTPVPLTFQTLVVLLAGATLGPWLGTASMALYLLLGITGYNVFAVEVFEGGRLIGPTAGYLIGFLIAQPLIGTSSALGASKARTASWLGLTVAAVLGHAVIFAAGLVWLSAYMRTDFSQTLAMGFWPFFAWTIIKSALCIGIGRMTLPYSRAALGR